MTRRRSEGSTVSDSRRNARRPARRRAPRAAAWRSWRDPVDVNLHARQYDIKMMSCQVQMCSHRGATMPSERRRPLQEGGKPHRCWSARRLLFAASGLRRSARRTRSRPRVRGAAPRTPRPCGAARPEDTPPVTARRPARSHALADAPAPLPALAGAVAAGLDRRSSCALVFTALSLLIPILVQRTIDDAIDGGDRVAARPVPRGDRRRSPALRFGINFTRRYATARIGITVEARLRAMLYDAYLRFPRAFYDRHATGEVISRATNDIYPVRYFIGWGVVQAIQSVIMLVGAAIVLVVGQREARALRRARDAADRDPDVLLRAPRLPDLARGAARRRAT